MCDFRIHQSAFATTHHLPQTTRLTFPFQQAQNVSLSYGSLDVADNGTSGGTTPFGVHEFDAHLRDVTGVARSSEDAVDFG